MNDIIVKASNALQSIAPLAMMGTMGLVGWLLQAVGTLQTDIKVLTNTVNFSMTDRYRGDDAKRDLTIRDLKIDALDQRLRDLEHVVRSTKLDVKQNQEKIEQAKRRP